MTTTQSLPLGQILPESNFGQVLTRLAVHSQTIVEIGCWRGGGSTKCLASGLVRPEQRMWSVEASPEMIAEARALNPDERITFLCGTILTPEECDPLGVLLYPGEIKKATPDRFLPPVNSPLRTHAEAEMKACAKLPYVGDQIPEQMDLLLLDGGEYSTRFEFVKLMHRARVIALDDIRKDTAWKNYRNHMGLSAPINTIGWQMMFHRPYERNGWSVFYRVPKRPPGHLVPMCNCPEDIDALLSPA